MLHISAVFAFKLSIVSCVSDVSPQKGAVSTTNFITIVSSSRDNSSYSGVDVMPRGEKNDLASFRSSEVARNIDARCRRMIGWSTLDCISGYRCCHIVTWGKT